MRQLYTQRVENYQWFQSENKAKDLTIIGKLNSFGNGITNHNFTVRNDGQEYIITPDDKARSALRAYISNNGLSPNVVYEDNGSFHIAKENVPDFVTPENNDNSQAGMRLITNEEATPSVNPRTKFEENPPRDEKGLGKGLIPTDESPPHRLPGSVVFPFRIPFTPNRFIIEDNCGLNETERAQVQAQLDRIATVADELEVKVNVFSIKKDNGNIVVVISGSLNNSYTWVRDVKKQLPDIAWLTDTKPREEALGWGIGSYAVFEIPAE
jgi:hypothetical protein